MQINGSYIFVSKLMIANGQLGKYLSINVTHIPGPKQRYTVDIYLNPFASQQTISPMVSWVNNLQM